MITVNTHIKSELKTRAICGATITPAMSVEKFSSLLTYYIDTQYKGLCPQCKENYLLTDLNFSPKKATAYLPTLPHRL